MSVLTETSAAEAPIELEDVKRHLRIPLSDTDEDAYISDLISSATKYCEHACRRSFVTQTLKLVCDGFPFGHTFWLERATPLQSVTSVQYYDSAGDLQTLASSKYKVAVASTPGRLVLKSGQSWPATEDAPESVEIIYVCGEGAGAANVSHSVKQMLRTLITHWFENRSPVEVTPGVSQVSLPNNFDALLMHQKVFQRFA